MFPLLAWAGHTSVVEASQITCGVGWYGAGDIFILWPMDLVYDLEQ
jgi:hypothetical protein